MRRARMICRCSLWIPVALGAAAARAQGPLDPNDAISREFSVFNDLAAGAVLDVASREFSVFNDLAGAVLDVASREFSVFNDLAGAVLDVASREFSVFNNLTNPVVIMDATSREFTIYFSSTDCNNNGLPDDYDIATGISADCDDTGIPDECELDHPEGAGFEDAAAWAAYIPGHHGVGDDPEGYSGAAFDGRYVYFAPVHNGTDYHGEVLRLDTLGDFDDPASWATYDPGNEGVGSDPDGFHGAVFDGRYVYFVPYHNGTSFHGEVLRYDTENEFADASSWDTYDPGDNGVGNDPDGYAHGVFDGRYVYFVPYFQGFFHGEVLRYDTHGAFANVLSWETFDAGDHGVGNDPDGYFGGVFDGRYVYFSPWCNGDEHHGEVLRYDTFGDFDEVSSWGAYDPGDDGVGEHPDGFAGAVFDGRYVYFVPLHAPLVQFHREVLRYDTSGDFFAAASWSTMEPDVGGEGYAGAVFDGRFVYFGPNNWSEAHGEVLRYDAAAEFTDPFAWVAYNPGQNGVGYDPRGYSGIVYDGRRVYFVPGAKAHNAQYHGEVLRYDTAAGWAPDCNNNGIPDACDIADGTSDDQNGNGIPDECEVWPVLPSDLEPAEPASPAEAKPLPPGP